ncbi:probable cytochrome P450 6a14 [Homalodisca vitripennis]|uniref:probable cytochrome P450 6a14 n=1 Tax=Homalodisca vitripennis TaxID=197043 RepID=UPI001EEBA670|nr:probable cytochrome P450 6a14 [Homalodisca vitripennis]
MAAVSGFWMVDSLLLVVFCLYLLYRIFTSTYDSFKVRGIPYLRPVPLLGTWDIFTKNVIEQSHILYDSFPGERFFGYFRVRVPTLVVKDVELIQKILVKDFVHFQNQGFPSIDNDLLSMNLFNLKGEKWRAMRMKLSPTFSSGKMKYMFSQFVTAGDHMLDNIDESFSGKPIDVKAKCVDFGTEVIASTAFGLDFSKDNPQTANFIKYGTNPLVKGWRALLIMLLKLSFPKLPEAFGMSMHPPEVTDYFVNLVKANKEYRKRNKIKRNDYFQLLMALQDAEEKGHSLDSSLYGVDDEDNDINQVDYISENCGNNNKNKLMTDECMVAQAMLFFMGGSESVTSTLTFALYHIAKDTGIQARAVQEVDKVITRHGGWTYQAVKEMYYLDMILQETLRFYPLVPVTLRECTLQYRIPETDVVLEKGNIVAIPVRGIHMDPKYHPNPDVFIPERFNGNFHKPNPTYFPFGDGPRMCIAMRFALVEMKVCLAKILTRFSLAVDKKTQEPLTFDKVSSTPIPVGIWLNFKKRDQKFYHVSSPNTKESQE